MADIMTPEHPQWDEFIKRLGGPEACDFRSDKERGVIWKCKGGTDKSFAIAILNTMQGVDVDGSLDYFSNHGGHCDCEIIFNVDH